MKRTAGQEHRIVFVLTFRSAKQFHVPNMQEQSKAGKKSEINRQTFGIQEDIDLSDIYLAVSNLYVILQKTT